MFICSVTGGVQSPQDKALRLRERRGVREAVCCVNSDIIEKYHDGRERVRFKTVPAGETADAMKELVSLWENFQAQNRVPDLLRLAAWNFDFLCVHPFRDGNGRVSRLLLLLQLYHLGYEVGRYISLERIIEETKNRYG